MKKIKERLKTAMPVIVYFIVYMTWFNYIEQNRAAKYTVIHMNIDDKIPFCEFFIIPYLLWFIYVVAVVTYLMFTDKSGYYKSFTFLATGMTIFLLVSTFWPNIQHLRPYMLPRTNIFTHMVKALYRADTPTNLWPSIHVYNSIGAYFGVAHNKKLGANRYIKTGCFVLSILIILSTVFLKQHSMFDVMTAFIMAAVIYVLVYRADLVELKESLRYSVSFNRHLASSPAGKIHRSAQKTEP